jgi:hypothetical protein
MAKLTGIDDDTEIWVVNEKKGEVESLDGFFVYHANRPKLKNKDFFFMFQSEHLTKLAFNENLQGSDLRLLLFLFGYLDFENYISITQKEIVVIAKTGQANISKSLKRLEEQGVLTKEKKGNRNVYRLNPSYAWKGKISEFQKDEKERKQQAISQAKIIQLKQKMAAAETPKIVPEDEPKIAPEDEPQNPSD